MIRVATTLKKLREGIEDVAPDGYNTRAAARSHARTRAPHAAAIRRRAGTSCASCSSRNRSACSSRTPGRPQVREYLSGYFSREICPVLTPLAFDPGHPFPFISNLSKNFAVVVRHGGRTKFARVKVPDVLPRFIPLPEALGARAGTRSCSSKTSSAPTSRSSFRARRSRARICSASSATPTS